MARDLRQIAEGLQNRQVAALGWLGERIYRQWSTIGAMQEVRGLSEYQNEGLRFLSAYGEPMAIELQRLPENAGRAEIDGALSWLWREAPGLPPRRIVAEFVAKFGVSEMVAIL